MRTINLRAAAAFVAGAAWLTAASLAADPGVAGKTAAELTPEHFSKFHGLIKPKPGGFDEVPWMTSLWEARKKAAAEGKPILLWVGDGQPLGWT
jgi:hypothetical protein